MAKQDSVLPRLNHNAQQNYFFNVGLEINLFNFYEITNAITNMPKCFPSKYDHISPGKC